MTGKLGKSAAACGARGAERIRVARRRRRRSGISLSHDMAAPIIDRLAASGAQYAMVKYSEIEINLIHDTVSGKT